MPRFLSLLPLVVMSLAMAAPVQSVSAPVLPQSFAGWNSFVAKDGHPCPNPQDAAVLQEFGLSKCETGQYNKNSSELGALVVRAWEFKDATGAYGAFTFYRQPGMHAEDLGAGGASAGDHFVFWTGATVVDATFNKPVKDEKNALAVLAGLMPKVGGGASVPPSLPHYLPAANLDASTVRYAIGPAAYAQMGSAVPVNTIDFGLDAEVVTAQYGMATKLTLIMYPTPQIAEGHLKTLRSAMPGVEATRSGPLVAVVNGMLPADKAQAFLASIHFNDAVTINHPEGYVSEGAKMYRLLIGITMLTLILIGAAILLGIFLGGGRALLRVMRGKTASALSDEEFISLHLEQGGTGSQES